MNVVLAQLNFTVGDLDGNASKIIQIAKEHNEFNNPDKIIVFTELAITGYPPLDLVDNSEFIDQQLNTLTHILRETESVSCPLLIGYIERNCGPGKGLFNSVAVCLKGKIIYNYRKRLLPTYDVFDEARYFEPGKYMGLWQYKGKRIGILICEDLWYENNLYTLNPVEELFNTRADLVIVPNASPSILGKHQRRLEMVKNIGNKYALPIYYVNQVGGNDDIVFDGNSFITDDTGKVTHRASAFKEDVIDYNASQWTVNFTEQNYNVSCAQFYYEQAVLGLKDYVNKCGFKSVVVGSSGGIDSAVVLALATAALGPENVTAITMPSQYSSDGSVNDSYRLCNNLAIKCRTVSIKEIFSKISQNFDMAFENVVHGVTEENMQARIRGLILMSYSNRYGSLLLTTGNKSELSVGYTTLYGDSCGGFNPIGGLYKTEIYELARFINNKKEIIPVVIIDKAPSAELAPGQKDEDSLPPYDILDPMLKVIIEGEYLSNSEKTRCTKIIHDNHDAYLKVLNLITKSEYKRRQGAICIKMHYKDFGFGRRVPIAQKWVNQG
jgi:NAD+ synthetase